MIISNGKNKVHITKTNFYFLMVCVKLTKRLSMLGTGRRKGIDMLFAKLKKLE